MFYSHCQETSFRHLKSTDGDTIAMRHSMATGTDGDYCNVTTDGDYCNVTTDGDYCNETQHGNGKAWNEAVTA